MKIMQTIIFYLLIFIMLTGCSKSGFLDKKPSTDILAPKTLRDFQSLLDNTTTLSYTGGLAQISSDDYVVSTYPNYLALSIIQRNAYIWSRDLYNGIGGISDWNKLYEEVFYCNSVLDGLAKIDSANSTQGQYLKGWALFDRAYAFYDLTRNFCKAYDENSSNIDLGIPLRLSPSIDYTKQRATLAQSFAQIFSDLSSAENLLPASRPAANLNRPSKIAVYALLARIYLDMRNYLEAENYANKCLALYDKLIDYNTVNKTAVTPFPITNDELIYNCSQVPDYSELSGTYTGAVSRVPQEIINLYSQNDLRLPIYFNKLSDGSYTKKRGYRGSGNFSFTGLATDEVYLIKAECLARRNEISESMDILNQLLIKRWDAKATEPNNFYQNLTSETASEALSKILLERRKELIWRNLRWHDLKRLNKEGAKITLIRTLNGITYTLSPNDPRYIFPIPEDEVTLSGIQQNIR